MSSSTQRSIHGGGGLPRCRCKRRAALAMKPISGETKLDAHCDLSGELGEATARILAFWGQGGASIAPCRRRAPSGRRQPPARRRPPPPWHGMAPWPARRGARGLTAKTEEYQRPTRDAER